MKLTLLYPPLDDPTMPYHGNAYLLGSLRAAGFSDAGMRDLNIEFVNFCLEESTVRQFHEERERRLEELSILSEAKYAQQLEFLALWQYQPIAPDAPARAAEELRCREAFLNYPQYVENVRLLHEYFRFIGNLGFPGEIVNFQQNPRGRYNPYTFQDLFDTELSDTLCYSLGEFFHQRLVSDPHLLSSDVFGISIIYDYQLVFALWIARAIKNTWPEKRVILGGTALSQTYKYMKSKGEIARFFAMCDAIVVGEGETAICRLMATPDAWNREAAIPNTITYDRATGDLAFPQNVYYEKVAELPVPVYEYPWNLYLSPERGINYSPTRGCYWNRCTFCDYGLNTDRPTSPWRERSIENVIADLQHVLSTQKIENVYFAVDVMAPGYLERLADAIVASGVKFRWSAELRMEKIFTPDRCAKMAEAGCVSASFGMESGNQRILDLIDKGTQVTTMEVTMRNFARSGIAVQLMTFHGFPTETSEEKAGTIEFIQRNSEFWSGGGLGTFQLTGTAIVARKPELFGITIIPNEQVDIGRTVDYFVNDGAAREALYAEDYDASFGESAGIFPLVIGRPWAGGIDTLHSMLYYSTYGRFFFKEHPLNEQESLVADGLQTCDPAKPIAFHSRFAYSPFNVARINRNRDRVQKWRKNLPKDQPLLHTYADFVRTDHEVISPLPAEAGYWIFNDSRCMRLDFQTYDLLQSGCAQAISRRELLAPLRGDARLRMEVCLDTMQAAGLIAFQRVEVREEGPGCVLQ